jgi:uncharacterized membrane protein YphA (DoxX/SURF4 family)
MLVVLRLALGWHFLYEGVWKYTHRDAFVAETDGFLSAARGPAAKLFYGMVPDIDGHQRLERDLTLVETKKSKESEGQAAKQPKLARHWDDLRAAFVAYYQPKGGETENSDLYTQFEKEAAKVCQRNVKGLDEFLKENGEKIKAHFESLQRFHEQLKTDPSTDFMRQRRWDQMQEYRKEAKGWIADLDAREKALKADLMDLLNKERKAEVAAVAVANAKEKEAKEKAATAKIVVKSGAALEPKPSDPPRDLSAEGVTVAPEREKATKVTPAAAAVIDFSPLTKGRDPAGPFRSTFNPLKWTRIEQLAFLLTFALLGIGLCLMLGLFTRLSALAGAGFMLFVVLSQPSYPGVYPTDPPQLGHALLVNKDFVEMIALLVIASTSLGRWTGMDFFLHNWLIRPFCRCCCGCKSEGEQA